MPSKKRGKPRSSKCGPAGKATAPLPAASRSAAHNAAALLPPAREGAQQYGLRSELRVTEHALYADSETQSWITALGGLLTSDEALAWVQLVWLYARYRSPPSTLVHFSRTSAGRLFHTPKPSASAQVGAGTGARLRACLPPRGRRLCAARSVQARAAGRRARGANLAAAQGLCAADAATARRGRPRAAPRWLPAEFAALPLRPRPGLWSARRVRQCGGSAATARS